MSYITFSSRAPTTASRDSTQIGSANTLRSCSCCIKLKVPTTSKFKMCSDCRERTRNYAKKYKDFRQVLGTSNNEQRHDSSKTKHGCTESQTFINSSMDKFCKEYQTSGELLEALKSLSISTSPSSKRTRQFHGSYAIVTAPDVDNLKRVWLLATELRAKSWFPFRFEPPLSVIGDVFHQTLCFACSCSGTTTTPALASNDENVSTNDPSVTLDVCRGVIALKAIVDNTHPLGIPGQRIMVHVEHPINPSSFPWPPLHG